MYRLAVIKPMACAARPAKRPSPPRRNVQCSTLNESQMIGSRIRAVREKIVQIEQRAPELAAHEHDVLEELYATLADLKQRHAVFAADPLIEYCELNPEADECRIYDV